MIVNNKTNKSSYKYKTKITNIRKFHNWTKRELITKSCHYSNINYNITTNSLLDLAVGSGCDIYKWYDCNIMYVIGFDINESSINEAKKRYNEFITQLKEDNLILPVYKFYVMDLSNKNAVSEIKKIVNNTKFDIVSCQFAIHYFFESETILNNLINIVFQFIKVNGLFIGTTMNGNKIMNLFDNSCAVQNNIFKIQGKLIDFSLPYNNKCSVMLMLSSKEK